jgi:16S rRNA (cytosine1402-N4)-methyltransferase
MIRLFDLFASPATSDRRDFRSGKIEHVTYHKPVLLKEVVALLQPTSRKIFVDGTIGGGGHSAALLEAGARVIGLDQDPEALGFAGTRLTEFGDRFSAVHANFSELGAVLDRFGIDKIDGGLLDIGVSSRQIDSAARGFSFQKDGPLDMRMNTTSGATGADLVNTASEAELAWIFREFGEESNARRIAKEIIRVRINHSIMTTLDLAGVVESIVPRRGKTHPATRVFQALRIAVNRELESLAEGLEQFTARLASGGRLAVITFHSRRPHRQKFLQGTLR